MSQPALILIAGPTASGKSAMAMRMAAELGAEIIGADSMQIYGGLEVLTAAPTAEDRARVPHHLVGVADAGESWSVGRWLTAALEALEGVRARGRPALIVGGTGLYFRALTHGLADIPQVSRKASEGLDERALRDALARLDPAAEARIEAGDRQRLIRAHAVAVETGVALSDWQTRTRPALELDSWRAMLIEPDRPALYARCDARMAAMIEAGALDEVRALLARGLDPVLPAMKAVGLRELAAHLRGETSLDEAVAAAQQETRRYAKRQLTWFRNQTRDWERVAP